MNITLLAKKGGVGKSTLSLLLYEAFRQAGKSVSIRDWDAQGTSSKALLILYGKPPAPSGKTDIVIYDTPPSLEHNATATAVRAADIVLVVTSPSPADIWEADDAVQFVTAKNPSAKIHVIFNKVRKATVLGRLVDESAKQLSVPVLSVTLSAGGKPQKGGVGVPSDLLYHVSVTYGIGSPSDDPRKLFKIYMVMVGTAGFEPTTSTV